MRASFLIVWRGTALQWEAHQSFLQEEQNNIVTAICAVAKKQNNIFTLVKKVLKKQQLCHICQENVNKKHFTSCNVCGDIVLIKGG